MKILFVTGQHAYGNPARGPGYEVANMLPGLEALGHSVTLLESFDRTHHVNFAALNRAFIDAVLRLRPDVILCVLMGYEIWTETLDWVRTNSDALVVNWGTDDSWKYNQFSRFVAPHVDRYATTSRTALERARADGHRNFLLTQWAANDAALARPVASRACRYGVSFVGAAYGNRRRWIEGLADRGIQVACFGHGWPNGPIASEQVTSVFRESVMSLNFGDSGLHVRGLLPYRSRQIKARVFEVPGAGGLLLTEEAPDLGDYYRPREEIVTFRRLDDLAASIAHYLANPDERDRIANAGHDRTLRDHIYSRRLEKLLAEVMAAGKGTRPIGAAAGTADASSVDALVSAHSPGWLLRVLRAVLLVPTRLLWGKVRGPRAARRIVFELSWRLVGAKTYSAKGWPGRIFYRES